jgi:hypothetical protein
VAAPTKLVQRALAKNDGDELVRLVWGYCEKELDTDLSAALWTVASNLSLQGKGPELARLLRLPDNPYLASTIETVEELLVSMGPSVGEDVTVAGEQGPPEAVPRAGRVLERLGMTEAAADLRRRVEERYERVHGDLGPSEEDPFPPLPNEGWWIRWKRRRLRRYFMSPNPWMGGKRPWGA